MIRCSGILRFSDSSQFRRLVRLLPSSMPRPEYHRSRFMSSKASPRQRPPPGLRGKEIGLWHAARSKLQNNTIHKSDVIELNRSGIDIPELRRAIDLARTLRLGDGPHQVVDGTTSAPLEYEELGEQKINQLFPARNVTSESDPLLLREPTLRRQSELDEQMREKLELQINSPAYVKMLNFRKRLPTYNMKDEIVQTIDASQVTVISGGTGCGKTTQVPQFILEHQLARANGSMTRIIVTQPRRISAISVAERVAAERGERLGVSVGYQVRLERCAPKSIPGSIMYVTTGMLLQWLHSDPLLQNASHVIVDEVHEREVLGDFLLTMLREIAKIRPELRIILMSATLNADQFVTYFGNCSKLEIPGRVFPVETYFLEDVLRMTNFCPNQSEMKALVQTQQSTIKRRFANEGRSKSDARKACGEDNKNLVTWLANQRELSPIARDIMRIVGEEAYPHCDIIARLTDQILTSSSHGAVLVFVPGIGAIREVIKKLRILDPRMYSEGSPRVRIYPLHSQVSLAKQRGLFDSPPTGQRKVIVATNIAETSITIEDVVYVIDGGRIKITNFDPSSNVHSLAPVLVSRSNAAQRRGRAGRTQAGFCYHLFSKYVYENTMSEYLLPEMLRMRLEDVILRIKLLQLGPVSQFLASCLSPPDSKAVARTLHFLHEIQALRIDASADSSETTFDSLHKTAGVDNNSAQILLKAATRDRPDNRSPNRSSNSSIDTRNFGEPAQYHHLPGDRAGLSALGEHLARLPLEPQLAKLLILGALFGCLEPALAVASCLGHRDPFEIPLEKQALADRARLELSNNTMSDHWVYVTLIQRYRQLTSQSDRWRFCERYFLRENIVRDIVRLMEDHAAVLHENRYIRTRNPWDPLANMNKGNFQLFRAILCGALYPNILKLSPNVRGDKVGRPKILVRPSEDKVNISPKSLNEDIRPSDPLWMVYFNKTRMESSTWPTVMDTTVIPLRPVIFFSGNIQRNSPTAPDKASFTVDDWIHVSTEPELVNLISDLRTCLNDILEQKFRNPSTVDWSESSTEGCVLRTIIDLLSREPLPTIHPATRSAQLQNRNQNHRRQFR